MDLFKMIRSYVLGDPAIVSEVGTRFYPVKLPQTPTYPAVTMQRISDIRYAPLKGRASLARARYQFDVWTAERTGASAFSDSQRIGNKLLDRLEGKNLDLVDDSVSPSETRIVSFFHQNSQDLFETDINGGYYRFSADYFIEYQTGNGGS